MFSAVHAQYYDLIPSVPRHLSGFREFEQAFHFKLRTEVIPYGYGSLPYEILKAQEIEAASYRIVSQFSTGRYCGVWGALRSCSYLAGCKVRLHAEVEVDGKRVRVASTLLRRIPCPTLSGELLRHLVHVSAERRLDFEDFFIVFYYKCPRPRDSCFPFSCFF